MDSDALARAARSGDEEAFVALLSAQKEKLYRMAYAYLRNEDDAVEAVQETAYRAWKSIGRLRDEKLFDTWIVRILLNCCRDEWRRRKKAGPASAEREPAADAAAARGGGDTAGASPEGGWALRVHISEAMRRLEPKYRQIILLKYFEDMTLTEIAAVLGRPPGTVKTRLHQALQKLRALIAEEEGTE